MICIVCVRPNEVSKSLWSSDIYVINDMLIWKKEGSQKSRRTNARKNKYYSYPLTIGRNFKSNSFCICENMSLLHRSIYYKKIVQ